jgi:hypothetical protein
MAKKLTHDEWQLVLKRERELLQELIVTSKKPEDVTALQLEFAQLKKGGSTCLDCTLGRSLPH